MTFVEKHHHYSEHWIEKWPRAKIEAIKESVQNDELKPKQVKCMVKREAGHSAPKKARCIQFYRNLATQAYKAPQFTAMQKALGEVVNASMDSGDRITLTFASGMNGKDLGEWMAKSLANKRFPTFYERDGKNWDATRGQEAFDLKNWVYTQVDPETAQFARECKDVNGLLRHNGQTLRYKLKNTVKSGHNDTTFGNNIDNGALTVCALHELGLEADVLVAGDDLLVVVEGEFDADQLAQEESKFGIVPEYRKFYNVLDLTFISGCFFPNRKGFVFTPKPGRLLRRLFWTTKPPPPKKFEAWRRGIVLGLMPTCSGMPVIEAFLRRHATEGGEVFYDRTGLYRAEMYGLVEQSFDSVSREAFMYKYGLNEAMVNDIEAQFCACGDVGLFRHVVTDLIEEVDLADVLDRPAVGLDGVTPVPLPV
jgi:hypothetical protein